MNRREQKNFINGMSRTIANDLCLAVAQGKIPPGRDGHELRCLPMHRHKQSAAMTLIERDWRTRRARDFWNHVSIANL